jgi:hypothetical protein
MEPRSDLIPLPDGPDARRGAGARADNGLTLTPAGSMARPTLPRSTTLSAERIHAIDLEEQMDPLAVAEATADDRRSLATAAGQLLVIALAAAAIWSLLPRGVAARPPLELPPPLQAEPRPISSAQRDAENAAIDRLKQAAPTRAVAAFRQCIDAPDRGSVNAWRYYLQTLVDLDERAELRQRAGQFLAEHPDRLEAAHFQCEALRRDDIAAHREQGGAWNTVRNAVVGAKISPAYLAEIDRCQNTINDALTLLQQHDADWSSAGRTAWADLLHLDRARLHFHAWKCGGFAFADPHREHALEALRQLSSTATADALALRLEIYRTCRDAWPTRLGFGAGKQTVNGLEWSKDDLQRAIDADRAALARLPPVGRR